MIIAARYRLLLRMCKYFTTFAGFTSDVHRRQDDALFFFASAVLTSLDIVLDILGTS